MESKLCIFLIVGWISGSTTSTLMTPDCADGLPHYEPYPYNCSKYYGCDENKNFILYDCIGDLYWNDEIKACDQRENTYCGITTQTITTTPGTNTTPTRPADTTTSEITDSIPTSTATPTPTTTQTQTTTTTPTPTTTQTRTTTTTHTPTTTQTETTTSTHTPTTTQTETTRSTTTTSPTRDSTTSSTTLTTEAHPTTPRIECSFNIHYIPYPYDCRKYYECIDNQPILTECPENLFWNIQTDECDYPWNVDCSYIISTIAPEAKMHGGNK